MRTAAFLLLIVLFGVAAVFSAYKWQVAAGELRAVNADLDRSIVEATRKERDALEAARREVIASQRETKRELKRREEMTRQAADDREAARQVLLVAEERLDGHFAKLRKLSVGENKAGGSRIYVRSFTYKPAPPTGVANVASVDVAVEPPDGQPISPDFSIWFFNKFGFVTGSLHEDWMIDRVAPGERRIIHKVVSLRFGEPVYWLLEQTE